MSDFVIIPDSSSDMTKPIRERFGIPGIVRGTVYHPDGRQILADVDWEEMTPEEYFGPMKGGKVLYKTATPPAGEIISVFESFLKEGKDILSISLSSAISGTIYAVQAAAKELLEKYPERKIICVDSIRYGGAEGLLVSLAAQKKESGATIEETAEYVNQIKHSIHQIGPLDDLFFCVKTGRISNMKAFFGTLVGVNSLADFSYEGLTGVIGKAKGRRAALDVTVSYVKKMIRNPREQILFVSHSDRLENALYLAEQLKAELNPKDIIINSIGMSCGASIGPGLCSVYFLGDPISKDNVTEKNILDEILNQVKTKK